PLVFPTELSPQRKSPRHIRACVKEKVTGAGGGCGQASGHKRANRIGPSARRPVMVWSRLVFRPLPSRVRLPLRIESLRCIGLFDARHGIVRIHFTAPYVRIAAIAAEGPIASPFPVR